MLLNDPDRDWERFGAADPYFGVLTHDKFRSGQLDDAALREFFETGERHLETVAGLTQRVSPGDFGPDRALEFGCGVGRVLLPLARCSREVVGVDVSPSMLGEARRNCDRERLNNVELVESDDRLSAVSGDFDFIHSFIVFQHIPVARGEAMLRRLVRLLREGGVGALHFTYRIELSPPMRAYIWTKVNVPLVQPAINVLRRRPSGTPLMQMNEYSITRLTRILHEEGCHEILSRATRHSEERPAHGVMLVFRKQRLPSL